MPKDCVHCCRALEEIERIVFQIEEITSINLSSGEHREAVKKAVKKIVSLSREARDVECQEV